VKDLGASDTTDPPGEPIAIRPETEIFQPRASNLAGKHPARQLNAQIDPHGHRTTT
jgi:hypothetical protein